MKDIKVVYSCYVVDMDGDFDCIDNHETDTIEESIAYGKKYIENEECHVSKIVRIFLEYSILGKQYVVTGDWEVAKEL